MKLTKRNNIQKPYYTPKNKKTNYSKNSSGAAAVAGTVGAGVVISSTIMFSAGLGSLWLYIIHILVFLIIFLVGIIYTVQLIMNLPFKPKWTVHQKFQKLFKFSPLIILGVLYLTNFAPTKLIVAVYTERMFLTYVSAILGTLYSIIFLISKPKFLKKKESYISEGKKDEMNNSKPIIRYFLTVLCSLSMLINISLTLILIPNSFKLAPIESWKDAFIIPDKSKEQEQSNNYELNFDSTSH